MRKSYVVTGAAGGLGAAAVAVLAERGANVLATDVNPQPLQRVCAQLAAAGGEVVARVADVTSATDVADYLRFATERWGGLDGIFNIAGSEGTIAPLTDTDDSNYDSVIRVNARSVWLNLKYGLPLLVERGGGVVVNTGSYLAIHGMAGLSAYAASKHAVVGLTRSAAVEYASRNIRVHVVCPGTMNTRMIGPVFNYLGEGDVEEGKRRLLSKIPRGKMAEPSDVASLGVWLLLDAPEHLNGLVLPVDGGRTAG